VLRSFPRDHYNVCACCTKRPVMLHLNLLISSTPSRVAFLTAAPRLLIAILIFLVYLRSQMRIAALFYKRSQVGCPRGSLATPGTAPPESSWENFASSGLTCIHLKYIFHKTRLLFKKMQNLYRKLQICKSPVCSRVQHKIIIFKWSIFHPRMQLICKTGRKNVSKSYDDQSRTNANGIE
jgi:hypothetical protein